MFIPRYRTIEGALKEIKKKDPNTALTHSNIIRLLRCGAISSIKGKQTWIINLDELLAFFWRERI